MLPTDNLLVQNNFSRSYRYSYRSEMISKLVKLPLPIPIPIPLRCPLSASLLLSAVKYGLLVTCPRPQRPPSALRLVGLSMRKGCTWQRPCINLCLLLSKTKRQKNCPFATLLLKTPVPLKECFTQGGFSCVFSLFRCLFFCSLSLFKCARGQTVERD